MQWLAWRRLAQLDLRRRWLEDPASPAEDPVSAIHGSRQWRAVALSLGLFARSREGVAGFARLYGYAVGRPRLYAWLRRGGGYATSEVGAVVGVSWIRGGVVMAAILIRTEVEDALMCGTRYSVKWRVQVMGTAALWAQHVRQVRHSSGPA